MTRPEERLHTDMIAFLVQNLNRHYGVRAIQADLKNFPDKPDRVGRHQPNIVGIDRNENKIIIEVETCKTVSIEHTRKQFKDFSRANGLFWVSVPNECELQLRRNTRLWNTPVDNWIIL